MTQLYRISHASTLMIKSQKSQFHRPLEVSSNQSKLLSLSLSLQMDSYSSSSSSWCSEPFIKDYLRSQMNLMQWFFLIAVTVLLLLRLFNIFRFWAKARLIPGPPFFSFYRLISGEPNFTRLLSKLHEEYGPVVKLWLGPLHLLVSIKDPQLIKEMLFKAEDKSPMTGRAFHLSFGRSSLFTSSFNEIQKRRDLLASELVDKWLERENVVPPKYKEYLLGRIQDITASGSVNCKKVSQHMAYSIVGAMLFGDEFLASPKATAHEELLRVIAKDACIWASYNVAPYWRKDFWRYKYLCTKLKSLTQEIILQCQRNCKLSRQIDETGAKKNTGCGLASAARHSHNVMSPDGSLFQGHHDAKEESCGDLVSVMFHGYLITAALIGSILTRLATNRSLQDEIRSEIIMTKKSSLGRDLMNVNKMFLLLATVYESVRLLPVGLLLQRCSLENDLYLKTGTEIPAGALIVVPVQLVQTDFTSWGTDAFRFNPYRFLSTSQIKGEHVDGQQHLYVSNDPNGNPAFLSFGSGPRSCLGQDLAILGVANLFATLLQHYEISLDPGTGSDSKLMIDDCILDRLPNPKIAFMKLGS